MERGEGSVIAPWASDLIALPPKFHKLLRPSSSSNILHGNQCFAISSLADLTAHTVELWWNGVFRQETRAANAAAVGRELFGVLNHGLQLVELCVKQEWPKLAAVIFGGAAEFSEVVDNVRRYSQMLNFLISDAEFEEEERPFKAALIRRLRNKTELDCCMLQETLRWASEHDKQVMLQELRLILEDNSFRSRILLKIPSPVASALVAVLEGEEQTESGESLPCKANISYGDLEVKSLSLLGRGNFGMVQKAVWCGVLPVAVKEFESEVEFQKEKGVVDSFLRADFPHIVQILGHVRKENSRRCLVLELMDTDLKTLIDTRKIKREPHPPFDLAESVDIMLQLAKGLKHLHANGIIHRDLKPQNVLVKENNFRVKVTDFGTSKKFETAKSGHTTLRGTVEYMAPEMLDEQCCNYSRKVDVFSFGLICFQVLTGKELYPRKQTMTQLREFLKAGKRPALPDTLPSGFKNLLHCCWEYESHKRPSFSEICDELWLIKEEILTNQKALWLVKESSFNKRREQWLLKEGSFSRGLSNATMILKDATI